MWKVGESTSKNILKWLSTRNKVKDLDQTDVVLFQGLGWLD